VQQTTNSEHRDNPSVIPQLRIVQWVDGENSSATRCTLAEHCSATAAALAGCAVTARSPSGAPSPSLGSGALWYKKPPAGSSRSIGFTLSVPDGAWICKISDVPWAPYRTVAHGVTSASPHAAGCAQFAAQLVDLAGGLGAPYVKEHSRDLHRLLSATRHGSGHGAGNYSTAGIRAYNGSMRHRERLKLHC
jgi:hypothetical protein